MSITFTACILALLAWTYYLHQKVKMLYHQSVRLDGPLKEVLTGVIRIQRPYWIEALKLNEAELDRAPTLITALSFQIELWKTHYAGEINLWGSQKQAVK